MDAVVVGAGPNGLAAAIELAAAGLEVRVVEGAETVGGGARTRELTLPGFAHDVCSAVHPLAVGSPFFSRLPLEEHGLEWIHSPAPLAHPLDDGRAILLERVRTGAGVGASRGEASRGGASRGEASDGGTPNVGGPLLGPVHADEDLRDPGWDALVEPFVHRWWNLAEDVLGPLDLPRHPLLLLRFGLRGLRSARGLARTKLERPDSRALFAGLAGHSVLPLDRSTSAAAGLMLAVAGHSVGWPIPRGGAGAISEALVRHLRELGGSVETGHRITSLDELPRARAILLDLTPRQVVDVAGNGLPRRYRAALERYRYGPGAWKVDWALDGPIPWAAPECSRAATVHLGGSMEEIARSEAAPWNDRVPDRPFVLLAQPSLFDATRAPPGKHTAWAYCHVPHGWGSDDAPVPPRMADGMTEIGEESGRPGDPGRRASGPGAVDVTRRIEDQVERFAPGFRDRILARSVLGPRELEAHNPNLVGGDIGGGVQDLGQLFFRPVTSLRPYRTPVDGLYLCSSSTPPGGGVHGMCGYHAARTVLRDLFD